MKLVIDIPESDYRYIKELQSLVIARGTCKTIQLDVINAIKNGVPYEDRYYEGYLDGQTAVEMRGDV